MKLHEVHEAQERERQNPLESPAGILRAGARLAADPELRRRLETDPRAVLMGTGTPIPENVEFRVVSNTDDTTWIAFPPDPNAELSDDDLAPVSGGRASSASSVGTAGTASCVLSCWGCASSASSVGSVAS